MTAYERNVSTYVLISLGQKIEVGFSRAYVLISLGQKIEVGFSRASAGKPHRFCDALELSFRRRRRYVTTYVDEISRSFLLDSCCLQRGFAARGDDRTKLFSCVF